MLKAVEVCKTRFTWLQQQAAAAATLEVLATCQGLGAAEFEICVLETGHCIYLTHHVVDLTGMYTYLMHHLQSVCRCTA